MAFDIAEPARGWAGRSVKRASRSPRVTAPWALVVRALVLRRVEASGPPVLVQGLNRSRPLGVTDPRRSSVSTGAHGPTLTDAGAVGTHASREIG